MRFLLLSLQPANENRSEINFHKSEALPSTKTRTKSWLIPTVFDVLEPGALKVRQKTYWSLSFNKVYHREKKEKEDQPKNSIRISSQGKSFGGGIDLLEKIGYKFSGKGRNIITCPKGFLILSLWDRSSPANEVMLNIQWNMKFEVFIHCHPLLQYCVTFITSEMHLDTFISWYFVTTDCMLDLNPAQDWQTAPH